MKDKNITESRQSGEVSQHKTDNHIVIYNNNYNVDYSSHWHTSMEILMPTENDYTVIINNNQSYTVKPYELFFIGPGVIHSTVAPETGLRYIFQIEVSHIKNIAGVNATLSFMGQVSHFTPENSPDIHRSLIRLFEEIVAEYEFYKADNNIAYSAGENNQLFEPFIYAKFLTMISLISHSHFDLLATDSSKQDKSQEYTDKIMYACTYIDEHFTEEITLEEVASKAGYSKFHFSRLFKQYTNYSFYKYVNHHRISYAEELLANPKLSITQIAIDCGYSTTSAFIRMFKQFKDCTPSDYRRLRES